jgi:mRNA-degrading endonuclease RelE of RelBE toxin-antitoxin system
MPGIELTESFFRWYNQLPPKIEEKTRKALGFLAENPRHPSFKSKPIEGAKGIYEARVDQKYRLTYERLPGNVLRIRVVGKHDEALKNP